MPDRPRSTTKPPLRDRTGSIVENLRRHPEYSPEQIRPSRGLRDAIANAQSPAALEAGAAELKAMVDEKRAARAARFEETVAAVDPREGSRQDPSRAGGRRKLDVSEETVQRMSRQAPMHELGEQAAQRRIWHGRTTGSAQQFDWFDRADAFERYEITREAARRAGVLDSYTLAADRERSGLEPTQRQIDAHNKMRMMRDEMLAVDPRSDVEMRERGEITRQAKIQSKAGDLADPIEYRKMRLLRDEMLSQDPRTAAEMRARAERTRQMIEERRAYRRADRASRLETRALAEEVAGAQRFAQGASRLMRRAVVPLAALGAVGAAQDAAERGEGRLGQALSALDDLTLNVRQAVPQANRNLLRSLAERGLWPSQPEDNIL